jgi:hypothetical protein
MKDNCGHVFRMHTCVPPVGRRPASHHHLSQTTQNIKTCGLALQGLAAVGTCTGLYTEDEIMAQVPM